MDKSDKDGAALLQSLRSATTHSTDSDTLSVIHLPRPIPIGGAIGSDILFSREGINAPLFDLVRSTSRAVLIGNAGTAKSMFQYYYLYRLINPNAGALGQNCFGSCLPPNVVIRQVEEKTFTVYFLKEGVAHYIPDGNVGILKCFDPETSLYLYEPGTVKKEPHMQDLRIPTFATVSPDTRRYKEFLKNGGIPYYMPVWSLKDLLAAGKYLVDNGRVPYNIKDLYKEESIRQRYEEFGGIFRHVLPINKAALNDVISRKNHAINDAVVGQRILSVGDIENDLVSHLILHYDVQISGNFAFTTKSSRFASESTFGKVRSKILAVDLKTRIVTLIRNDETGYLNDTCPAIYEQVVADLLTQSREFKFESQAYDFLEKKQKLEMLMKKDFQKNDQIVWQSTSKRFSKLSPGVLPKFKDMEEDVLYLPLNTKFPVADLLFKKDDVLYGIQVTRNSSCNRKIETSALNSLLKEVGMSDSSRFRFILCPSPKFAEKYKISYPEYMEASSIEVWKLPKDYGLSQM
jgi:hypothetical protein